MSTAIKVQRLTCKRCGHGWVPRKPVVYLCPQCKSPRWDVAKGKP